MINTSSVRRSLRRWVKSFPHAVCALTLLLAAGCSSESRSSSNGARPERERTAAPLPPQGQFAPVPVARLEVRWTDATPELAQLAAGLTREEALALGIALVLTGTDTYGARVRLANTGNVPVNIFPENIAMHFDQDAVGVTTLNHARFLQRGILQPGHFTEGLVMYRARVDVGAIMRFGGGSLSYNDRTIQISYPR